MPESNRSVLVTGANGFVGRNLLPELVNAGYDIRALIIPNETPFSVHLPVTWIEGDIRDLDAMRRALETCGSVVHLAGLVANPDPVANHQLNTEATESLLSLSRETGCGRFLFMSAAAAKFIHPNAYGQSKRAAEDIVAKNGIDWAVLRAPLIIGEGSEEFDRFVELVKKIPFIVPIFGRGETIKRPVAISDVIEALMAIIDRNKMGNRIYEIACPEAITLDGFVDAILNHEGLRKRKIHVPYGLSLFMAHIAEVLLGQRAPVTRDIIRGLNENVLFDIDDTVATLELNPKSLLECLS